ncbi:hypothetical protein GC175_27945 [bacterium]|nr:hypothetical protein [bacterium]
MIDLKKAPRFCLFVGFLCSLRELDQAFFGDEWAAQFAQRRGELCPRQRKGIGLAQIRSPGQEDPLAGDVGCREADQRRNGAVLRPRRGPVEPMANENSGSK